MALSARDRRAVILGAAALAAIIGYVLVVRPVATAYGSLVREHAAATRAANRRADEQRRAEFLAKRVKDWEEKAGELVPPKPYSEQITSVLEQIVAAAQEADVKLQGTTPGAPTAWPDDPQVSQAPVQIEAQSEWENVFKFVVGVYRVPGVVSVEQLDLTGEGKGGGKGEGGGNLKVRMTISVIVAPASENRWAS
ncbi:MAG: type 4a pilus biogenesis protein PilO [Planctomycetes bacterium]|nr:type 4a pilus biogenesis protein PilO [Planctomycetota bacterium]